MGESHHLANTVPPELWERVVVIRWPLLLSEAPANEHSLAEEIGPTVCGLALEHALQVATVPPLNSCRRCTSGDWQPRNLTQSRSRGAIHAQSVPCLTQLTLAAWSALSEVVIPEYSAVVDTGTGRAVSPTALHQPPSA